MKKIMYVWVLFNRWYWSTATILKVKSSVKKSNKIILVFWTEVVRKIQSRLTIWKKPYLTVYEEFVSSYTPSSIVEIHCEHVAS